MHYLNMLSDIAFQTYESDHIYRIYCSMPLLELLKEYRVATKALSLFHDNDLESSIIMEYLPGVVQIMQFIIAERVDEFVKLEVFDKCM